MAANAGRSKESKSKAGKGRGGSEPESGARDYAREALRQWGAAARLGVAALSTRGATKGAGVVRRAAGATADWALSKTGLTGKLASKLSLGSRALGDGDSDSADEVDVPGDEEAVASIPIQESIEVAVPIGLAYRLATRFEDYPQFLAHAESVTLGDGSE